MAQLYTLVLTVLGAGSMIAAPVSAVDIIAKPPVKCPILCSRCPYGIDTTLPCPGCCCPCYDPCKNRVCPTNMHTQVVSWKDYNTGNIAGTCCNCVCNLDVKIVSCRFGSVKAAMDRNGCNYAYCDFLTVQYANMSEVRLT